MNNDELRQIIERSVNESETAYSRLFNQFAPKLTRAVSFEMDPRMRRRVEPTDIVQEAFVEAHRRLPDFLEKEGYSFYVWLRAIAMSRLKDAHRRHVLAKRRSVLAEESGPMLAHHDSMREFVDCLVKSGLTPSRAARKSEYQAIIRTALSELDQDDREILSMRFVEGLSSDEIAQSLNVSDRTVRRRVQRAILELGDKLRAAGLDETP